MPSLMMFDGELALVCHDAGSANIVITNLLKTDWSDGRAYMQGPAEDLWKSAFPTVALCKTLFETLEGAMLLVTGTSWASDIEHQARKLARSRGLKSVAVIDHWVNYKERFVWDGEEVWPDEFWVTDDYAMQIAQDFFPTERIFQMPNYYVEMQLSSIASIEKASEPELLYVLEPIRSDWGRGVAGEFQALDYFVRKLPDLDLPSGVVIRLRPHPSDAPYKYREWISHHLSLNIQLDESLNITRSLGRASWVAGCQSFALALALMAGRKAYCTLPSYAPKCLLPHSGIIHIKNMNQEDR